MGMSSFLVLFPGASGVVLPRCLVRQLSELVRVDGYLEWVELAADFTVKSFKEWQWSTNSIHYLLALWGRLVAAVPYVRADTGAKSHTETLQVTFISMTYGNLSG